MYEKVKANEDIINIIAGCQRRYDVLKDCMVERSDDFTYLAVNQIKVVERLLKEVIVQNMPAESRVYKRYNENGEGEGTYYTINNGEFCYYDSREHKDYRYTPIDFRIECGSLMYMIYYSSEQVAEENYSFFRPNKESPTCFQKWVNNVRNGYLHTHMIKEMSKLHFLALEM